MSKYSDKVKRREEQARIAIEQSKRALVGMGETVGGALPHVRHSEFCNYCETHKDYCFGER